MGAKFIIDRRCTVKTELTLTGLIESIKYHGVLQRIGELAAAGMVPACDADARVDMILPADSTLPEDLTIGDLQAQAEVLMAHRVTCRQCPSSLRGHVGGCIAYVPYPISEGMEFLLWKTAVRALRAELPESMIPTARAFAERARELAETPFAKGLRGRGDLLGRVPRVYRDGPLWRRRQLSSAQVLDRFFWNGLLVGDALRIHAGFLGAVLAVARALVSAVATEEQQQALQEDIEPYTRVHELMLRAVEQGQAVYVWP